MTGTRSSRPAGAVAAFFALKIALGAAILIASAHWMSVQSFAIFSQLLILIAYLTSIGTAGVQNGLIRQIAASEGDEDAVGGEVRAALAIWITVALIAGLAAMVFRGQIAILLTGTRAIAWVVPWLALFALWAGLGQLLCSILTGTRRAPLALLAQAIGLVFGTIPAMILLHRDAPIAAALTFTGGQGATTIFAAIRVRTILHRAWTRAGGVRAEIGRLLAFSIAFLATASIMPLTLIGLRSIYRTAFGLDALGYWLAANRISDINTQLLGLYMVQAFLPAMTATAASDQRRMMIRTAGGAVGIMAIPLVVFIAAPRFFVGTFLSAKFLPGAPFFIGYFAGDVLRVGASTASYTALARGNLRAYVGLEILAAALIGVLLTGLTWSGILVAPPVAYAVCYALIFIGFTVLALRRREVPRA